MSAIALLTDSHNYYLYAGYTDMRKSIDGLCGIVYNELGKQVDHKDIFIFLNRRCTHIKLLLQEADGFTILYRRLHKGRFMIPTVAEGEKATQLRATDLLFILSRLHLHRAK